MKGEGMKAKEYLGTVRKINFRIKQKEDQLNDLKELQGRTSAVDYSGDKVSSSFHGYAGMNRAVEILELEQEIEEEKYKLIKLKREIITKINTLENQDHIEVLTLRYCNLLKLNDVARTMNYSFDWVRHLHGIALTEFQKVIDDIA